MKNPSFLYIALCVFAAGACDTSQRPLTDPAEMYERGVALIQEKSFRQAQPLLEQAVQSFRALQNTESLGEALTFLAQADLALGEFRAAFDALEQAKPVMHQEGDVRGEINLALLEGDGYASLGMCARAISCYRTAFSSATSFDAKIAANEAQIKLASILQLHHEFEKAQDLYKNVLAAGQEMDDRGHVAAALLGIGSIDRLQHRNVEALNSLNQGVAAANSVQDPIIAARLQEEIGLLHASQNNVNGAIRDFRDAVNILRRGRTGREYETILLFRLGRLYEANGRPADGRRFYLDALESARAGGDLASEYYLQLFLARCDFNAASPEQRVQSRMKLMQQYEQIALRFGECSHIAGEGFLYTQLGKEEERLGNTARARELYLRAAGLDQNALAEYTNGDAYAVFQSALGITPSHREWYDLLCALLVKLKQPDEAFKIFDDAQMRQTAADFRDVDVTVQDPKFKQQTREARALLQKTKLLELEYEARLSDRQHALDTKVLNALHGEIESAKLSLHAASRRLVGEHPNDEGLLLPDPVDADELRRHIPRGALVVEFLPTDDQLMIFAATNAQLVVRTSPIGRDSLMQLMREYQQLLQDPSVYSIEASAASVSAMTRFEMLSTRLYDWLLRPVDDLLGRSLIVSVSQEMAGFPFHALERQDRSGNVKYVIEIASVDYIPSLGTLRYQTSSAARIQGVVAFGNPTGKNWSIDYELRDIRSFFRGAKILVGIETSWDNLKSIKTDVLQLSTEFNRPSAEFPLGDFILSDGLTAERSANIPFERLSDLEPIPVMVLSNQYGQGAGLSSEHALMLHMNGVADVFLNAWLADRKAGKFFSEYFYTNLAAGLAPGDAYRQALLHLIQTRELSRPHSWAQFFHYGVG